MKFRVDRDVIADAVAWAARSLPIRSTNPVLTGLHIVANQEGLVFSGNDGDVSARVTTSADVAETGTVLVPGRLLSDITKSLSREDKVVEIIVDASRASLTCGRSAFTIPTMPVAEYPPLPELPESSGLINGAEFAQAINQVAVASSRDETLPAFTGIKIDIEGSVITLAATDRYRLAMREIDWSPTKTSLSTSALVPAKFLAEASKALISATDVSLALASVSEGIIGIEGAGKQSTSRMLAADFPKYKNLLPSESNTVTQIRAESLKEAVKRVSLVLDREQPVSIHFSGSEAIVRAGGGSGDIAKAEEVIECLTTGDDISIAFNPHYLLDGLSVLDGDIAVIAMTISSKPAVITSAKDIDAQPDDSFKYLLMPIRQP